MKPSNCSHVSSYLLVIFVMAMLLAASYAQNTNTTVAPPICNLNCPAKYTCFDNSFKNISRSWGHNGHVCSSDLECYGEEDPRGTIRGPKQFPTTMQEGDTLRFESYLGRFSFKPFNATREAFDKCTPFSEGQAVIASESSSFTVPQKFLSVGVHYFIANSSNFLYECIIGLRAEVFVQSRQPCLNPQDQHAGVCSTKGLCASNGHFFSRNYSCLCCTAYKGRYCEELDSCSPTVNPCQNEANCTEITAGHNMKFKCTCAPGFTGEMCEINIDECKPKPCINGGFCTDKTNGYECLCPPGASGTNCEVVIPNLCEPNPCLNRGTCERSGNQRNNYTCICVKGRTGRNCTDNVTSSVILSSSFVGLPSSSLQVSKTISFRFMSTSDQASSEHTFDPSSEVVSMLQTVTSTLAFNLESSGLPVVPSVITSSIGSEKPVITSSLKIEPSFSELFVTKTAFITSSFRVETTTTASYVGTETSSTSLPVLPEITSSLKIGTPVLSASDGRMVSASSVEGTQLMSETVGLSSLPPSSSTHETRTPTQHILATSTLLFETPSATLSQISNVGTTEASSIVLQPSDFSSLRPSPVVSSTAVVDGSSTGVSSGQPRPELTSVSRVVSSSVLPTSQVPPTSMPPVPTTRPIYNLTCADSPCDNNGTCRTVDSLLKFKCECPDGTWGPLCSKEFDLHFPRFSSNSFLVVYKPIAFTTNGNKIVLTFSTNASDGLLFYSVHSKHRDFIELRVMDGKLEFRFDPGDSLVVLTSQASVNTGKKITAVVSYDTETRIGSLRVNNNTAVTGRARGKLYGINLNGMWYIGGVPSGLIIRPGVQAARSPGFQGCIRDIEFNEVPVKANDSVSWYNIDECDTPACGRHPCKNGATCEEEKSNPHEFVCRCVRGFSGMNCEVHSACAGDPCNGGVCVQHMNNISLPVCLCPYEKAGRLCEERISINVSSFTTLNNYASYLEYRSPETGAKSFDVMFQFRAESTVNGLIVYAGQNRYLGGGDDFLAIGVSNNKLVLQYNLGSGVANIESAQNISTDWHVVTAGRKGRIGYLYVDGTVTHGQSPGELAGLNIFTPLYIGGVPSFNQLPNVVLFKRGFQGSVYDVSIKLDGTTHPLSTSSSSSPDKWKLIEGLNVKNESFDDCNKKPCKNNGVCISRMGATFVCNCTDGWDGLYCTGRKVPCVGYNPCSFTSTCRPHDVGVKCDCSLGLTGEFCKQNISLKAPVQFNDLSYIAFKPKTIKAETKIRIRFKPTTNNGILFYVAHSLQSHSGDFLSITLHDGFAQFRYDLGSGVGKAQSDSRITLNQWHVVTANRSSQTGSLQLDSGNVVQVVSPSRAIGLDVQSNFYLGGVPQLSSVSPRAVENTNDLKDFTGCISEFKVNKNTFSLTRSGASEGRNIGNCAASNAVKTFR